METVLKALVRIDENSKLLRKNLENKTSSKDRRTSSRAGRRRSDSESDAKESTRRRSRSSSNDVTVVSVQSSVDRKSRKKKKSAKKRSRSSSTSSVENDTKRTSVFDEKVPWYNETSRQLKALISSTHISPHLLRGLHFLRKWTREYHTFKPMYSLLFTYFTHRLVNTANTSLIRSLYDVS